MGIGMPGQDNPVGPDAESAVAQIHSQIRIVNVPGNGPIPVIQHNKIIAKTMHLPEINLHC
jgi:hypothetical protein